MTSEHEQRNDKSKWLTSQITKLVMASGNNWLWTEQKDEILRLVDFTEKMISGLIEKMRKLREENRQIKVLRREINALNADHKDQINKLQGELGSYKYLAKTQGEYAQEFRKLYDNAMNICMELRIDKAKHEALTANVSRFNSLITDEHVRSFGIQLDLTSNQKVGAMVFAAHLRESLNSEPLRSEEEMKQEAPF